MTKYSLAALLALTGTAFASDPVELVNRHTTDPGKLALEDNPTIPYDPYSVLVRFTPAATAIDRQAVYALVGGRNEKSYWLVPGLELLAVPDADAALSRIELFGTMNPGLVSYAEPNYFVHATLTPNDPSYGNLWGMHNTGQTVNGDPGINDADIDAPEAWNYFTGNPSFVVGVIDTGLNYNHQDLSANSWLNPGEISGNNIDDDGNGYVDDMRGYDFYNNDNNPIDDNSHGSHCSGTIGGTGNNGIGVVGVNWTIKIAGLKFLNSGGSGSTADAIEAVQYCTGKSIKVSNNSWGGGGFSQSLFNAIDSAQSVGHIFCAAAGNNGSNNDSSPFYPANNSNANLIAVLATTNNDARASFSNYGNTTVDLGAPGQTILSTVLGNSYSYFDGTSMATPHVSGVVALVYGQNPTWTWTQVRDRVFSTVRPVSALSSLCVYDGVVNASNAIISNAIPVVTITAPADGGAYYQGGSITFTGNATDTESGNLTGSMSWTSSINGSIGSGGSFSTSSLSLGTHTITASATDGNGQTGTDTIQLTILAVPLPPADPSGLQVLEGDAADSYIYWVDNATDEATYTIERQTKSGASWGSLLTINLPADSANHIDASGQGGYRFRVRCSNAGGNSNFTSYVMRAPKTPGNPQASQSAGNVTFSWTDSSQIESGYTVTRQKKNGGTWINTTTFTLPTNSTSFNDAPGSGTWRYRTRANNAAVDSKNSAWKQVTIP